MELSALRSFKEVEARNSFSAAAQALGVSQPTLSRQISVLEKDLRIKLFDRIGRNGVFITPAGQELMSLAVLMMEDEALLRHRAQELSNGVRGTLRIGATPQTIESFLSPLLADFKETSGQLEYYLVEESSDALHDLVHRGRIDLAITTTPRPPLSGSPLYPLAALAVVPLNHPLGTKSSIEVSDLADEGIALFHKGYMTRALLDGAAALEGFVPKIVLESRNSHILLQLAEDGLAISLVPSTLSLSEARQAVKPVFHRGTPLSLWMCIVRDTRRTLPSITDAFITHARNFASTCYPGRDIGVVRDLFETR